MWSLERNTNNIEYVNTYITIFFAPVNVYVHKHANHWQVLYLHGHVGLWWVRRSCCWEGESKQRNSPCRNQPGSGSEPAPVDDHLRATSGHCTSAKNAGMRRRLRIRFERMPDILYSDSASFLHRVCVCRHGVCVFGHGYYADYLYAQTVSSDWSRISILKCPHGAHPDLEGGPGAVVEEDSRNSHRVSALCALAY